MAGYLLFLPMKLGIMRSILVFTCTLLLCQFSYAQTDGNNKTVTIKTKKGIETPKAPQLKLKVPNAFDPKNPENKFKTGKEKGVDMTFSKNLVDPGRDLVLDPKIPSYETGGQRGEKVFGDMYLGDLKTTTKFIGIVCRDHEFVDGDRVKVLVNDLVIEPNLLLAASFKGINVDLDKGFNRLDFVALNQGSAGPNTAQVDVYDDKGKLIYSNRWLLSTGSKASLIIVKE